MVSKTTIIGTYLVNLTTKKAVGADIISRLSV